MESLFTDGDGDGDGDSALRRQLAVTPFSSSHPFSSTFSLPHGSDKYHIQPETGLKFGSISEAKRYMNVEEHKAATTPRPLRLEYNIESMQDRKMITCAANMTRGNSTSTLPENWVVEEVPRSSQNTIVKYYRDTETGRKLRSLKDVERYFTGESSSRLNDNQNNSDSRKMIVCNEKVSFRRWVLDDKFLAGWIVEEVPRRTGNRFDRFFYEPGTGHKFRSWPSVQRHLAKLEENSSLSIVPKESREHNLPLSKADKSDPSIKKRGPHDSSKKTSSAPRKEAATSSFPSPPSKINWVMASSRGDKWNAFHGDTIVQDGTMQQWRKRFMSAVNNVKDNAPM